MKDKVIASVKQQQAARKRKSKTKTASIRTRSKWLRPVSSKEELQRIAYQLRAELSLNSLALRNSGLRGLHFVQRRRRKPTSCSSRWVSNVMSWPARTAPCRKFGVKCSSGGGICGHQSERVFLSMGCCLTILDMSRHAAASMAAAPTRLGQHIQDLEVK